MNKPDCFLAVFLGCAFGSFFGSAVPQLTYWLRESQPKVEVVSDQPAMWSQEESLIRGAADANFDADASGDYKQGWKDCCAFLLRKLENE